MADLAFKNMHLRHADTAVQALGLNQRDCSEMVKAAVDLFAVQHERLARIRAEGVEDLSQEALKHEPVLVRLAAGLLAAQSSQPVTLHEACEAEGGQSVLWADENGDPAGEPANLAWIVSASESSSGRA